MDRSDFCKMLVSAREKSNTLVSSISFDMKMNPSTIYRMERGLHSFSMGKLMEYLRAIKSQLIISKNNEVRACVTYSQVIEWLKDAREEGGYSQDTIADLVGIWRASLSRIESQTVTMKVDTFLRTVNSLGYTVKIIPL